MKLCFTSHVRFYKNEGQYLCTGGFARLVEMIAPLYEQVELCIPVFDFSPPKGDAAVSVANLKICALPAYYNRWEIAALRHPVMLMRLLWPIIKRADAVFISLPRLSCRF
jgi:hypothetical protein